MLRSGCQFPGPTPSVVRVLYQTRLWLSTVFLHCVGIDILNWQRSEVKPAQSASLEKPCSVESRVLTCEVIRKLARHINGELVKVCVQRVVGLVHRFLHACRNLFEYFSRQHCVALSCVVVSVYCITRLACCQPRLCGCPVNMSSPFSARHWYNRIRDSRFSGVSFTCFCCGLR